MSELLLSELLRPELFDMAAYAPEAGQFEHRLDANEAPALLGEAARARLAEAAAETAWERYPDATAQALRQSIAKHSGVTPEEILVGVGSDEVITMLLTALSQPRSASGLAGLVTTTPTFVMYRLSARVRGMQVLEVPLDAEWNLSVPAMVRAMEMVRPNITFIASPNNPTGTVARREDLEQVIEAAQGGLVVIDEAYVDYAAGDHMELYRRHSNVALLRTLSKVGFAALRIGWLVARPELVREVDKVRLPYNVTELSQRLGRLVLDELPDELGRITRAVIDERQRMTLALGAVDGVRVTPSEANFLWLRVERPAQEVFEALQRRGILVRSFHQRGGRLAHQLRVTVGTRPQNDALLGAIGEVI